MDKLYKEYLQKGNTISQLWIDFEKLLILPYTRDRKGMSVIAKEKSTKKNYLFSVGLV
jgi:hypothetical protein